MGAGGEARSSIATGKCVCAVTAHTHLPVAIKAVTKKAVTDSVSENGATAERRRAGGGGGGGGGFIDKQRLNVGRYRGRGAMPTRKWA